MNEKFDRAKAQYEHCDIPDALSFAVASGLRQGERARRRRGVLRRSAAAITAACVSFALLVNVSPAFAAAVEQVPILGSLARVVTVSQYSISDREHLIDVRLPALEHTGHTDLEQRINAEIQGRIQAVLAEAEQRAKADRDAFLLTGGKSEDFIPVIIHVDYELKCQSEHFLSFLLTSTQTQANAYTQLYTYNIDLETGREVSLADLLGPDYRAIADRAVRDGIAERSKNPENVYFSADTGPGGFTTIRPDQPFYLNENQRPVLLFEKYEIAPGYMGLQEFEIPAP